MARRTEAKHWLVFRGEAQWLAWVSWQRAELNFRFFPPALPVPTEWPPETQDAANAIADHYRKMREEIAAEERKAKIKNTSGWSRPIPIAPAPWIRWSEFECRSRMAEFNRDENPDGPYKRTNADMDALLAKVGRAPMRPRLSLTASVAAGRSLTESEAAELAAREKSLANERVKLLMSRLPAERQ